MNITSIENLAHLECPICLTFMHAPIRLCAIGHSLCSQCAAKLYQCPTCKQPLPLNARNYALEEIAAMYRIPCRNQKHGCNFTAKGAEMRQHEELCAFSETKCPLSEDYDCRWMGCTSAVRMHCTKSHPKRTFTFKSEKYLVFRGFCTWNRNIRFLSKLLCVHNQLFKFVGDYKADEDKTRWCVLHLSTDSKPKTKYVLSITFSEDQDYTGRTMSLSGQIPTVPLDEVHKLQLDKHYLICGFQYLKDLVKSRALYFKIEIYKL